MLVYVPAGSVLLQVNVEYCGLLLKIAKDLGGGSITGKENSTELACNYTKVIDWPQRGGMGVTESPEYLVKSPPTYCIHHSHPEVLDSTDTTITLITG